MPISPWMGRGYMYEQRAAEEAEKQRQLRMQYLASQPPGEAGVIRGPTMGERIQTALPMGWYEFGRELSGVGPSARLTERLQKPPEKVVSAEGADWAAGVLAEAAHTGLAAFDLAGVASLMRAYAVTYGENALHAVLEGLPEAMKVSLQSEVGALMDVNAVTSQNIRRAMIEEKKARGVMQRYAHPSNKPLEVVDEVARGQWFHGRRTYPESGSTFRSARRNVGNLGEPEGLSLTADRGLLKESFAKTGQLQLPASEYDEYLKLWSEWDALVERPSASFTIKESARIDDLAAQLKHKVNKWSYPEFKNFVVPPEQVSIRSERLAQSKYPPLARVHPKFGDNPAKVVLPAWKAPETQWAQDILKESYIEAIPEEVFETVTKMSAPHNQEFTQALSGLEYYRERLVDKYGPDVFSYPRHIDHPSRKLTVAESDALTSLEAKVDELGSKVWDNAKYRSAIRSELENYGREKFNKRFTEVLKGRGWKGLLYSPERYGEFELRMFDPDDVMMLDMRTQEELGKVMHRTKQRPRLEKWSETAAPREGASLKHIYQDIDWSALFHKQSIRELEQETLRIRYGEIDWDTAAAPLID